MSDLSVLTVDDLKNHVVAARYLAGQLGLALGSDATLWRYDAGVYRPDGQQQVEEGLKQTMGTSLPHTLMARVVAFLKAGEPTLRYSQDPHTINFLNGVLDYRTGAFEPHSPLNVSTIQVPHRWNPEAPYPYKIMAFLESVAPEDQETGHTAGPAIFLEMIGYAMTTDNSLQKMFLLHGPGGNGKSQILHLVKAVLGPDNYSTVTVHDLADDRFAAAELQGKLANIAGDLDAHSIKRTDTLKMISGGDAVRAQRKHGQPFKFVPHALQVFSANEAPHSLDQSGAWYDRWIVVPMENRFRGTAEEVRDIGLQLAADEQEMEGLILLAARALHHLMKRGHFSTIGAADKALAQYQLDSDSVRAFITERTALDPEAGPIGRDFLYETYRQWTIKGGGYPVKQTTFTRRVMAQYARAQVALTDTGQDIKDAEGNRQWRGIRLL